MEKDYELKLAKGYKLTTLQVVYYLPDYGSLLNEFIWQLLDLHPQFPRTHQFLIHWKDNIEAPIKEVNIAQEGDIYPKPFTYVDHLGILDNLQ